MLDTPLTYRREDSIKLVLRPHPLHGVGREMVERWIVQDALGRYVCESPSEYYVKRLVEHTNSQAEMVRGVLSVGVKLAELLVTK